MFTGALTTDDLSVLRASLGTMPAAADDAERVDRIRLLAELTGAVGAAQALETAAFAASQRTVQRAAGVPAKRVGRGIAAQVALAMRESPFRAERYVGWSTILTTELPVTFAALRLGRTTQWRAMLVARETAWLAREDRTQVDGELGAHIEGLGDRQVEGEAKRAAYRLDPHGYVDRLGRAESERRVTLRPAPDVMARLSALLPMAQGVAAQTALGRVADAAKNAGDARSRGQIMADTLVARLTGQVDAHGLAATPAAPEVPVEVCLVMTDTALLGQHVADYSGLAEPAEVLGYGPVLASWARNFIAGLAPETPSWIRRLYRDPGTGELITMESRRRCFTPAQRKFITLRDRGICRTPWCGAPIRHVDHVVAAERGGPTRLANAQGLCAACNHAKQAVGWRTWVGNPRDSVVVETPTGHRYPHALPRPPRPRMRLTTANAPDGRPRGVNHLSCA